jgi:WD40 repeat protein
VATGETRAVLAGHSRAVRALDIARNGRWLATGSDDCSVRIWDAATWKTMAVLDGHVGTVTALRIAADGTWLATGSDDCTVRAWDVAGGTTRAILTDLTAAVTTLAIAPSGSWIATGGARTLLIWDVGVSRICAAMRIDGEVWDCAWLPDGSGISVVGTSGVYLFSFLLGRD